MKEGREGGLKGESGEVKKLISLFLLIPNFKNRISHIDKFHFQMYIISHFIKFVSKRGMARKFLNINSIMLYKII